MQPNKSKKKSKNIELKKSCDIQEFCVDRHRAVQRSNIYFGIFDCDPTPDHKLQREHRHVCATNWMYSHWNVTHARAPRSSNEAIWSTSFLFWFFFSQSGIYWIVFISEFCKCLKIIIIMKCVPFIKRKSTRIVYAVSMWPPDCVIDVCHASDRIAANQSEPNASNEMWIISAITFFVVSIWHWNFGIVGIIWSLYV